MSEDFNSWKQKLKEYNDIVSVVSKYVTLQKKGKRWWGNCPFHFEKTPSFTVNEMDQYYHCYGCGASGDVITFISKIESCDFMEACEILAKNANIAMPTFKGNVNNAKLKKDKETAYNILKEAALYYYKNLGLPESKPALDYIQKRNLDNATIKAFAIGYSLGWTDIIDYLTKKGYSVADLKLAGITDEKKGRVYDAYAGRLIFPIINSNNDVIGFSARILDNASFAKYKNTAQTVVFDKSRVLYGINNVKKFKQTQSLDEIIIVEGQMDLISLYKSDIKNAVATMGTSLTSFHANELKRYCDKAVLCFDGDSAGKKAALRSIDILNSAGLKVYVASLPNNMDPDEYIIKYGRDEYLKVIKTARFWTEYLIYDFASKYNLKLPNEKSEFIINSLNVVKKLNSESEQDVYLELIKSLTNISIDVLKSDLKNIETTIIKFEKKSEFDSQGLKENAYIKAVKFVLASLLHKNKYAVLNSVIKQNLTNGDYIKIYDYIENCVNNNKQPIISTLFDMFDVENNEDVKSLINYEFIESIDNENYYNDCIIKIESIGLLNTQQQLTEKLNNTGDLDERRNLAKQLQEVTFKLKKLSDKK